MPTPLECIDAEEPTSNGHWSAQEELLPMHLDELLRSVLDAQQKELFRCMDAWLARQRKLQAPSNNAGQRCHHSQQELLTEFVAESSDNGPGSGPLSDALDEKGVTKSASNLAPNGAISEKEDVEDVAQSAAPSARDTLQSRYARMTVRPQQVNDSMVYKIVHSWKFEAFFAVIVITNSVLIGVQVEIESTHLEISQVEFSVVGVIYTLLFTAELVLRMMDEGLCPFLFSRQKLFWNYLDLFIVLSSICEGGVQVASWFQGAESSEIGASNGLRMLRLSRTLRIARIFRVIKVIRFVQSVRTLCRSILATLRALLSSLILLLLIIYVFGILFTDGVTSYRLEQKILGDQGISEEDLGEVMPRFGSLHRSMHTLFRSISNGLDWDIAARALETVSWAWTYLFTAFIVFCCFAVLNVMTAMFCQSAMESSQVDLDETSDKQVLKSMLQRLLDANDVGVLTSDELEVHLEDPDVIQCLLGLEVERRDVWTLFRLLDHDKKNMIDIDAFIYGCTRMKCPVRAVDVLALRSESWSLQRSVKRTEMIAKKIEHLFEESAVTNKSLSTEDARVLAVA